MAQREPIDKVSRTAEAACANMSRFGIPPTPNNYLIWFSHCSGSYPELTRVIRSMKTGGERFTEEALAEIHERFFGTGGQVRLIDETCERIEGTMSHLLDQIGGLSEDTDRYGTRLGQFGDQLAASEPPANLRATVLSVLAETREFEGRARRLEGELTKSSQCLDSLRSDLAHAQREVNTDGLTGIANRKCFDYRLRAAIDETVLTQRPLSLLLADIDHFKSFNDTFGHPVGDQVLKLVAQVLAKSVKGRDLPARYGGEEFAVILPQTNIVGARSLAEQLRATVAGNRIRLKLSGQNLGGITMSIGCAQYRPGETPASLIERTDEALYRAKREGRNRVVATDENAKRRRAGTAA
jgi:diguanylate cyclase